MMKEQQNSLTDGIEMILELLDIQNQKFKELLSVSSNNTEENIDAKILLYHLGEYISVFELEESVMNDIAYTKADTHKEHHQYFIQTIKQFQFDYKTNNTTITPRIIIFMKKWLVSHIVLEHNNYIKEIMAFNVVKKRANLLK